MKRDPIFLSHELRTLVLNAFVAALRRRGIELIIVSLDNHHLHILARFPDHKPRHWIGLAKKDSARLLSDRKLVPPSGIWAKRSKCLPVRDRAHQLSIVRYLHSHAKRPRHASSIWSIVQTPRKFTARHP